VRCASWWPADVEWAEIDRWIESRMAAAGVTITVADINWELAPPPQDDGPRGLLDLLEAAVIESLAYRLLAQLVLHELHSVQLDRDVLDGQRHLDLKRAREKVPAL
jgi:hypothetical protein